MSSEYTTLVQGLETYRLADLRPYHANPRRGDVAVLEPFAGTGSTLIAAHDTGRVCYTAELSPAYVDTTVRRWQQHTGGTPQRNGVPHSLEP